MLWDQHRERYEVGGTLCRRITYWKFRELTAGMTDEDMARIGRLNAKRESGAELTTDEQRTMTEIAAKWPVDELRGACLIPPTDGEGCRRILAELPRAQSEKLEAILDDCITPSISKEDIADPLALALVRTGGLGIDTADMTVGQGFAIAAMLSPREGEQ